MSGESVVTPESGAAESAAAETADMLSRVLEQSDGPQSVSQILAGLPGSVRPRPAVAEELLRREVSAGRLWRYPDVRRKPQYWNRPQPEFARLCLLRKLQEGRQPVTEVLKSVTRRKALTGVSADRIRQLLEQMIESGAAHVWPPFPGHRQTKRSPRIISCFPPDPGVYLRDAFLKIAEVLGRSREEILRSAAAVAEYELRELAIERSLPGVQPGAAQDERLLEGMRSLNPRVDDGDMVLIRDLRRELDAHMPGADFDAAVLDAVYRRRLAIHRFDRPNLITAAERSLMIRDNDGHFYNTISLWRN